MNATLNFSIMWDLHFNLTGGSGGEGGLIIINYNSLHAYLTVFPPNKLSDDPDLNLVIFPSKKNFPPLGTSG